MPGNQSKHGCWDIHAYDRLICPRLNFLIRRCETESGPCFESVLIIDRLLDDSTTSRQLTRQYFEDT